MDHKISEYQMLEKLDNLLPDLVHMRDRMNQAIATIKLFRSTRDSNLNQTKIDVILRCTLDHFDISLVQLRAAGRGGDGRKARQIISAMARKYTNLSLAQIGDIIQRDHATVLHSIKIINNAKDTKHDLYDHYEIIEKNVDDTLLLLE